MMAVPHKKCRIYFQEDGARSIDLDKYIKKQKPAKCHFTGLNSFYALFCGEGGIRTLGTTLRSYDGLANR